MPAWTSSWKLPLLSLAVALPALAYAAGALTGPPEPPAGPERIVLEGSGGQEDDGRPAPPADPSGPASPAPTAPTTAPQGTGGGDSDDGVAGGGAEGDGDSGGGADGQDDVVVVTPRPTTVGDDDADDGTDDGADDDGAETDTDTETDHETDDDGEDDDD